MRNISPAGMMSDRFVENEDQLFLKHHNTAAEVFVGGGIE